MPITPGIFSSPTRTLSGINAFKENIVLIGMPSSGKSTIGKILSEQLNKKLIDTSSENCLPESNEPMSDFKQKIDKLILLHDSGILSDEEFEEQKQRILEAL